MVLFSELQTLISSEPVALSVICKTAFVAIICLPTLQYNLQQFLLGKQVTTQSKKKYKTFFDPELAATLAAKRVQFVSWFLEGFVASVLPVCRCADQNFRKTLSSLHASLILSADLFFFLFLATFSRGK